MYDSSERVSRTVLKRPADDAELPPRVAAASPPLFVAELPPHLARELPPPFTAATRDSRPPVHEPRSGPLRVPPPPPPSERSAARSRPAGLALASVRLDSSGAVMASQGSVDLLSQLVAYVGRLAALLSQELSLDAFSALHAELLGLRVVVFQDAGELVGLMLEPGQHVQELRQRLGV